MELLCSDGWKRIGRICGKMRCRTWMTVGDTVLVQMPQFPCGNCDIIYKYSRQQVEDLKKEECEKLKNMYPASVPRQSSNNTNIVWEEDFYDPSKDEWIENEWTERFAAVGSDEGDLHSLHMLRILYDRHPEYDL